MRIPSLLLTKLYVKGSLRNRGKGFQFTVRNVLAPGTVARFLGLSVDGREYPSKWISLVVNGVKRIEAVGISLQEPISLGLGNEVTVKVRGQGLSSGPHQIVLRFLTKEAGELEVPLRDTIDE